MWTHLKTRTVCSGASLKLLFINVYIYFYNETLRFCSWHNNKYCLLTQNNFFILHFTDVGSVEGLAYHRGWDTLYWTSYTTSTITRHTVDQSRSVAYNRNTVVTMSGEDHPRAFVLDECQE